MPEETRTQEVKTELKSERCLCPNLEEPKTVDFPNNDKTVLKKDNEIKERLPVSVKKDCPRFDPCPDKLQEEKKESDAEFICPPTPRVLPSPPLGLVPKTVPLDYWTPLAKLSGTRPNVDKYSLKRYSPAENRIRYQALFKENNENVHNASLTAFNALKSLEKAFAETEKAVLYNDLKLSARTGVLFRWKVELERDISDMVCEIGSIQQEKNRLQRCIHAIGLVKSVNNDMKKIRCLRMEPELIRDQVDEEVIKESIVYEEILSVYKRCADHINQQLQELKDAKQRIECDWSRKEEAYEIDTTCLGLRSTSPNILWKPGSIRIPQEQSSSISYEQFCRESILQSQNALQRSRTLRINMKNVYESSVRDLRTQADKIDIALDEKIEQTLKACCTLENELAKCLQSLAETEALIEKINNSVKKLDGAMKCTQTRLDNRLHREFVENCRDIPQFGLIDEAKSLSENVTILLAQKTRAEEIVNELIKSRKEIEKEIIIKRKTLYVDRDRCRVVRSFYPSVQGLAGY